ncbi:hypothetical protein [Lysinibacillus xylanilyticus]|uniref:hypothetical protein n=1 Tax=Lysinibacillus xylanilyticus TaxID=582475 RepID=UPI003CFC7B3A
MHDGIVDMFNFNERNSQLKNAKHILVITVVCKRGTALKKFFLTPNICHVNGVGLGDSFVTNFGAVAVATLHYAFAQNETLLLPLRFRAKNICWPEILESEKTFFNPKPRGNLQAGTEIKPTLW